MVCILFVAPSANMKLLSTMLFSHDNNVVTILFSHHCCNNLLTNCNKYVNNNEHGCSIDTKFSCSKIQP